VRPTTRGLLVVAIGLAALAIIAYGWPL
jgi:hypothetical protein